MSLKDYFNKAASLQALSNKSAEEIASEIESVGYHEQDIIREERFIPRVDYSLPGNFARYGSAAEYYSQALKRIYEDYPYDGSLKEKIEWENNSTYLDLHIFEKDYPRTNGYINFSADGYGSSTLTDGYGLPATPEYIYLKGGPHPNSDTGASYAIQFTGSNVYETNKNRESNLKFDLQDNGASVEFWLKKDAFDLTKTEKEVIFDLWNGETSGSTSYGRFRLELTGASGADCFRATVFSGTVGFEMQSIADSNITSETVTDGNWHHYALTLKSGSSGINSDFYVDGTLNNTVTLGTVGINEVTGTLRAYVGALISSPTSSAAIAATAGKLSGSLDEFRYWKSQRTGRDIGRFWFTQIGGGTNDDPTPFITTTETVNTDLGVYYKFNEGITGVTTTDSVVLDFSGRVSNGAWTGYTSNSRNVGSAIVDSGAAIKEFKDPIIYSFHPDVEALSNNLQLTGSNYDANNNASMYYLLPSWITEEDAEGHEQLRYLTQIMSSYFDTLHLQIESLSQLKNITYNTGSNKPLPFAEKLLSSTGLVSPNLFIDADVLEKLADRSEDRVYEKPLEEIKNTIYQNIYNNLVYIYKTKGTEKSFRNLIRCFGIDDELVKLNMYASNIEYEIRENRRNVAVADRFVNFNTGDNVDATVYQLQDPTDTTNTTGYFAANTRLTGGYAQTFEIDVDFPTKIAVNASYYADTNTISASLFGVHGVNETESDTTWDTTDAPNFQVYAVRDELESDNVRFVLTGTAGGFVPSLESDLYEGAYQDTHWNLAVRIKPDKYPLSYQVAGADQGVYTVELHGVQVDAGVVQNEFTLSGDARSGAPTPAGFVTGSKRVYIGAHRTNFTGSLLQQTDVKINSARYWFDYLEDDTLRGHAHDTTNYGSLKPHFYAYPFNPRATGSAEVLKTDTLALNWEFSQNTGSNASGEFTVIDMSSGSAATAASRFGWLGPFLSKQYSGAGYEFAASSTSAVDKDFQVSSKLQLPENVQSSDMVTVLNLEEQNVYNRDSRPVDYFFAFEKSMAQAVSSEMINYFATLKDINTLIGAPVNRYRPEYKGLKLLRARFFDKVSNSEIDFEKFYEFYKWFDSSLTIMLQQLIPASADFAENVRTIIESHMLERSKYQHKFQNVKKQDSDPEGTAQGNTDTSTDGNSPEDDPTGTGFYSANATTKRQVGTSQPSNITRWSRTHAPIGLSQRENSLWWQNRAERWEADLSSSAAPVNSDKQTVLNTKKLSDTRAQQAPYKFTMDGNSTLGGIGFNINKKIDFVYNATQPFSALAAGTNKPVNMMLASGSGVEQLLDTADDYHPAYHQRLGFEVDPDIHRNNDNKNRNDGNLLAPFSVYSSSIATGYNQQVIDNYAPSISITNMHADLVYDSDMSLQSPFADQHVGGREHRHIALNTGDDDATNRPEAWKIEFDGFSSSAGGAMAIVPPNYAAAETLGYDKDIPVAHRLRNVGIKRPVNIRNIQTVTGTVAIGNYEKNYQVVQSAGRTANDPFFNDQSFDFALTPETLATRGKFPLDATSTANISGNLDYTLPNRTGTNSNQTIIVNRFSSPGGYTVQSRGYMDPAHEELSVYNALPYRNLSVLDYGLSGSASVDPTLSNTIRVQDQIDKPRGLNQRATLHAGPFGSDAAYGSVPELTYVTTPSYHKTNRNAKKRIESASAGYVTGTVYDNLYVQHQIPRSTQQYAWVTASLAEDKTIYGLQTPTCVSASSLDMLITGSNSMLFVGADNLPTTDRIPGDFVGLRSLVTDPVSAGLADLPEPLKVTNNKCVLFTKSDSAPLYYAFTGSAELNTNQSETIMWWVLPASITWGWYLLYGDHSLYASSDMIFTRIGSTGWYATSSGIWDLMPLYSWAHVTMVNDWSVPGTASSQVYINGAPLEMTTYAHPPSGTGNWTPGDVVNISKGTKYGLTGYISDIQWYNVAMSPGEVDAVYGYSPLNVKRYAPSRIEPTRRVSARENLVGWYRMGDGESDIPSTIYNQMTVSGSLDNLGVRAYYSWYGSYPTMINLDDFTGYAANSKTDCVVTKYSVPTGGDRTLGYPLHELYNLGFPLGGSTTSYNRLANAATYDPNNYKEIVDTFNTLMLNRNGPYGYPTWKQIRVGEGPVARKLRSENKIGQVKPPQMLKGTYGLEQALYPTEVTEYIEAPIADSAQPVVFAFEDNTDFPDASNNVLVKASFQNNLDYFTNTGLNSRLNLKVNPEDGNVYNTLTDFTLQSNLSTVVKYGQKIYPAAENTFRTRTRTRENYDISNIWNDARTLRSVPDGILPLVFGSINSQGDQDPSASIWPLDSFIYNSGLPGTGSGAGELMNPYSRFSVPGAKQVTASATYVMPLQYGDSTIGYGSLGWSPYILTAPTYVAAEQAGISPYQPYLDYAQNIRVIGKDMSIIPEFRISEHIAEYELNRGSDFLAKLDNIFNLTGASIPDSSQSEFYNVYSTADFMKYFKVVDDDLADKANGSGTRLARHSIELACDALLQFLPYKGFYPAERTQELGALLSQSLGEIAVFESYNQKESVMRRIIYEPLISPGILFNTIKSGIACSNFVVVNTDPYTGVKSNLAVVNGYPTYDLDTTTTTKYIGNWNNGGAGGIFGLTEATLGPLNTQYVDPGDPAFVVFKGATGDGPVGAPYNNEWNPCLNIAGSASADTHHNGYYMHKIPFEALRDPDKHLGFSAIPGGRFFDTGIGSASLDTAMDGYAGATDNSYEGRKCWLRYSGKSKSNMYKLGMDNFLCETYNFFLGSTEKTTFLSKEEDNFLAVEKDKYYGLQVRLAQSTVPVSSYYTGLGIPTTFGMYSRASAFGAPLILSGTNKQGTGYQLVSPYTQEANMWASYEHVLPPSYYGEAMANIIVKSKYSGKASIDELLASAVIEYNKKSLYNGNDPRIVETLDLPDRSVIQAQIDSSVDLFEKHLVVPEGTTTQKARWMIRPKFETPVLNFYNVDAPYDLPAAAPYIATGSYGQKGTDGMVIRGMWHQYGNKVSGSEGLYLSVAELPTKMSSSTYGNIAVESLSKIVGFDTNQKRIGDFAESKKVEEAIVCIPFLTSRGERKYFNVEKDSQEYLTQLALLNKYIFPPTFDFLTNQDVNPIAFYAFEFDLVLSQDDLVNIWQNLPPSSSTKFEKKTSTIKIRNLVDRLLDNDEDLQWMVFKVKRRAEKDYNILTHKNLGGGTPIVQPSINSPYSYNWPYDYFSFVELIKIGADVVYATEDLFDEEVEETPVKEKLREFIPATKDMSLSIAPRAAVIDVPFEGTTKPSSAAASKRATKSSVSTKTATSKRKGSSRKKR